MKLSVALMLLFLLAGCRFFDAGSPMRGPMFLVEPEPSMVVVRVPAGLGEPEVADVTYRVTVFSHAAPASVRLQDYEIQYFDMDDRPLPSLDLGRRPLPAPLLVGAGQRMNVELDVYRPVVGRHGMELLSTLPEAHTAVISARVSLFGRDQAEDEFQVAVHVPIRFERRTN